MHPKNQFLHLKKVMVRHGILRLGSYVEPVQMVRRVLFDQFLCKVWYHFHVVANQSGGLIWGLEDQNWKSATYLSSLDFQKNSSGEQFQIMSSIHKCTKTKLHSKYHMHWFFSKKVANLSGSFYNINSSVIQPFLGDTKMCPGTHFLVFYGLRIPTLLMVWEWIVSFMFFVLLATPLGCRMVHALTKVRTCSLTSSYIISVNMMTIFPVHGFTCRGMDKRMMHMMCFLCSCVCYWCPHDAAIGIAARHHINHHCLRKMITVAIPLALAPPSPSPCLTTLHCLRNASTSPARRRHRSLRRRPCRALLLLQHQPPSCGNGCIHGFGSDIATTTFSTVAVEEQRKRLRQQKLTRCRRWWWCCCHCNIEINNGNSHHHFADNEGWVDNVCHNFCCSLDSSSSAALDVTTVNVLTIFER